MTTEIVKLVRTSTQKNNFMLTWMMGSVCNYACSYCPDRLHDGKHKFPATSNNIKRLLLQLISEQPQSKIFMEILGGEPTYWKHLAEFAHFCKEHGVYLDVITNGYRDLDWWKQSASSFGAISFSFHSESASKDHFLNVVPYVSQITQTAVSIMMKPDKFEELEDFAYELHNAAPYVTIALKPLRLNMQKEFLGYTEKQISAMKIPIVASQPEKWKLPYSTSVQTIDSSGKVDNIRCSQLLLDKNNEFKNWFCMAGIQRLFIDIDGKILPAGCRLEAIGHLDDTAYIFPKNPIVCPHERCVCIWDLTTEKFKNL